MPFLERTVLVSCLFSWIWVMKFAKGNLDVCLACRTAITELITVWYVQVFS